MNSTIPRLIEDLANYIVINHPSEYVLETLPRDQSLVERGVLDSYGVIELVEFIEDTWDCRIEDQEITREKMGSITKMAQLIASKLDE